MTWTIENQAGVLHPQGSGVESSDAIPVNPQDQEGKVNILRVDDRPDKLLAVETIIAELGQNIVKAGSGLEALRHLDIILTVGRDDRMLAGNQALSHVLWAKEIWHALRIWDGWYHDWPHWRKMLPLYIGGHD